jgi:hypothetical protein
MTVPSRAERAPKRASVDALPDRACSSTRDTRVAALSLDVCDCCVKLCIL